jgi:hypothetical protein
MVPLRHLGRDGRVASIMIEVNRRLYLQPDGVTPKPVLESLVREIRDRVRRGIAVWDRDGQRRG